jgi:hypothetical protein
MHKSSTLLLPVPHHAGGCIPCPNEFVQAGIAGVFFVSFWTSKKKIIIIKKSKNYCKATNNSVIILKA